MDEKQEEERKKGEELLRLIKARAADASELARDLTAKIYMGIFNWITISDFTNALRKMDMLREISTDDAVMIAFIDEFVDLVLARLVFCCKQYHAQAFWLDTVKEFHDRPFYKRHETELFTYTHECLEYCRAPNAFFNFRPAGYITDSTVKIFTSDFDAVCADNPKCIGAVDKE